MQLLAAHSWESNALSIYKNQNRKPWKWELTRRTTCCLGYHWHKGIHWLNGISDVLGTHRSHLSGLYDLSICPGYHVELSQDYAICLQVWWRKQEHTKGSCKTMQGTKWMICNQEITNANPIYQRLELTPWRTEYDDLGQNHVNVVEHHPLHHAMLTLHVPHLGTKVQSLTVNTFLICKKELGFRKACCSMVNKHCANLEP